MPSRNQKKRSKQRAEYLQKQDDTLSQENKAKARARYKADPEKKKASVRDSYNADIESKQSAKRQRYQEDVEENRAAKRQKYEDNSAAIKTSERNRYWNDPAVRLAKRAAERKRYRRGHRTTTTTQRYVMACCIALALKSYRKMCMQHVYSTHVSSGGGRGGGRGGAIAPGRREWAPAKANKKKARPTKQRENNDSIQV